MKKILMQFAGNQLSKEQMRVVKGGDIYEPESLQNWLDNNGRDGYTPSTNGWCCTDSNDNAYRFSGDESMINFQNDNHWQASCNKGQYCL
ncbi:hypothetical protein [Spirosoma radiotolerans]|uniref:Uncharacterized protein n=1 Tax=Spirosoma radiotolerans TaxID=1379870 RepID=A0A0E3V8X0_9BACT|nr:hypothetical protein [Spirosoma radiotolerans]AKD56641.1 hypothetical protein SD10_18795 [Spirosoma radiotolerans]